MVINPKTQAVIDAFIDAETPRGVSEVRKARLKADMPRLYKALEELTEAVTK